MKATRVAFPVLALLIAGFMLIPSDVFQSPSTDALYEGFDPEILYVDTRGYAPTQGLIEVSTAALKFITLPNSNPTVHLLTTPLGKFNASLDVLILDGGKAAIPLRIDLWSPRYGIGYSLLFSSYDSEIRSQIVKEGQAAQRLVGGKIVSSSTLGFFTTAQFYHLEISIDKTKGALYTRLTTKETSPSGRPMLLLKGGPGDADYSDVVSLPVSIEGGKGYSFGGSVRVLSGNDSYKIVVGWYDADMDWLGYSNDWRPVKELGGGWIEKVFEAVAPLNARYARLFLGSGLGTHLLFTNLYIKEVNSTQNLLPNGDFLRGDQGWEYATKRNLGLTIIEPSLVSWSQSIDSKEFPELFNSVRLSLTLTSYSDSEACTVIVKNYKLILPHQRWALNKIEDVYATSTSLILLASSVLLLSTICMRRLRGLRGTTVASQMKSNLCFRTWLVILAVLYLTLNLLLFNLGSHPFDMDSAKVWAYITTKYGPAELYFLPQTVSLARVWNGAPYHEAAFFYQPVLAYLSTAIGWVYKVFFSGVGVFAIDDLHLEFVVKGFNVLFGMADSLLIYLILTEAKTEKRLAILASFMFLFNPAVILSMSIWGQNHVISVFFLLASIWFAENKRAELAWVFLGLGVLTRPQMLVPSFILLVILLRRFSIRENLYAFSTTIILIFVLLGPLALSISPTLPIDVLKGQLLVQEGGWNEQAITVVSLDAYNIWPLITYFSEGARSLSRFFTPSAATFIANFTYQQVSQILTIGIILLSVIPTCHKGKIAATTNNYLPLVTFATLGFLVVKTGLAAAHYIIGLPFLILCVKSFSRSAYLTTVISYTTITFVPMFGSFALAVANLPASKAVINQSTMVHFFISLFSNDRFITLGCVLNLLVLVMLGRKSLWEPFFTGKH